MKRFDFRVEINAGALGWVDITADVRGDLAVTRGLTAEGRRADPGRCQFTLDNPAGRYSPRNPASDLYGYIGRNTPVRVSAGPTGGTLVGRFVGEVLSWPPRWSLSGKDRWVNIDASGLLRRFRQGDQPARSPMRRTIEGTAPVAYWPGEDGTLSGQAGSATSGLSPLLVGGAVEFKPVAAYTTFTGSTTVYGTTALADLAGGGHLAADLPAAAVTATAAAWTVHAAVRVAPATLSADLVVLEWTTSAGTYTRWQLKVTTTNRTQVIGFTPAGAATTLIDYAGASTTFHHFAASASILAGTVTVRLRTSYPISLSTTFGGTMGGVTAVTVNPGGVTSTGEMPAGHVAVWDSGQLPVDVDGITDAYGTFVRESRRSYLHEAAVDRLIRVAVEAGLSVDTVAADPQLVSRMGVQPTASTTALLDESIAVDGGLLFEARDQLALAYLPRGELYNVAPVTIAYVGQTSPPFDPADDADDVRNDITVERRNGSSVRAVQLVGAMAAVEPPTGVGIYTTSETLNVDTDADLTGQAGWRLHLGTIAEPRYPAITVQLASPEWLAGSAATLRGQLLALDVGGVLEVTGAPAWVSGQVRTLVTGYTETITEWTWKITYSGPPASGWDVAQEGGNQRVPNDGATLAAPGVTATATTLPLATTGGQLWTTKPSAFPLDLLIGGAERVTVSAITGAASPQSATATRSVNGVVKAWPAGTSVDVYAPAIVAL